MTAAHTIGLDFGTLSVRAAVVRVDDGEVVADAVREYATPVMERTLASTGQALPPDYALQVPGDYLVAMEEAVRGAMADSGVDPAVALEALAGGLAGSRILEAKGAKVIDREFSPTFTTRLHAKDMAIVRAAAQDAGCVLPVADRVNEVFAVAIANGLNEQDHSAVVRVAELLSGTHPTDWSKEP